MLLALSVFTFLWGVYILMGYEEILNPVWEGYKKEESGSFFQRNVLIGYKVARHYSLEGPG